MATTLSAATQTILDPLARVWQGVIYGLPGAIAAIVIILVGYFTSLVVGYIVKKLLVKSGIDNWMIKMKLDDAIGHINLSSLLAVITKWYLFIIFLIPASNVLQLGVLSDLFEDLTKWLPNLIVALVIVIFGLVASDYVHDKILRAKIRGIKISAVVVKWLILVSVALVALSQIGIQIALAENLIYIIVGAVALAFAIAVGIGFGLALKDESKEILKSIKKRL